MIEGMPTSHRHHMGLEIKPQPAQVPDEIQHFVPGAFIRKPQAILKRAVVPHHQRILIGSTSPQSLLP